MPSIPSSSFKTKPAKGKVQIIMNDDEIFHLQVEKIGCLFHRFSTSIHERHWFGQEDLLEIDPSCSVKGSETFGADRNVVYLGDTIHDLKPNIMPAHSILGSRIPQAYDDFHIRLFFLLLLFLLLLLLYLSSFHDLWSRYFRNLLLYRWGHDCGDGEVRV